MSGLLDRLAAGEVLVADGAMGTMLLARGLRSGDCPERLNLERPELLTEIARLYLEAGAQILLTNTFGASPLKLAHYGLAERCEEINLAAVQAVRDVANQRALVACSVGPCGKLLEPHGDASPAEVTASFEHQAAALQGAGVDLYCVETMTDLAEATLAIRAIKTVAPDTPIAATMTFDHTPRGFFTIMGVTIAQAAAGLAEAGADIIGSNCGNGIEKMVEIAAELRKHTDRPLIIQSNAGLPELVDGVPTYSESPEFMAERCAALPDAGVSIIGGCCGTTPAHIAAIRQLVDSRS